MKTIKISELPLFQSLQGLFTIGTDSNNRSVKVPLESLIGGKDISAVSAEALNGNIVLTITKSDNTTVQATLPVSSLLTGKANLIRIGDNSMLVPENWAKTIVRNVNDENVPVSMDLGDIYFVSARQQGGTIIPAALYVYIDGTNDVSLGVPVEGVVYTHKSTGARYMWGEDDGVYKFIPLGNSSGGSSVTVIDDLVTGGMRDALSARQGKILKANIITVQDNLNTILSALADLAFTNTPKPTLTALDWTNSGGGETPTPSPSLTVSESQISINAEVGTPETATFTVTAANLTGDISISVSGTGFSVSPATIIVKNGSGTRTVTVTYNPSAAGTHTGTVTVQSSGITRTVTINGTATAAHDTISDYVQQGLVFHLDGINKGGIANQWTDLINDVAFPNHGATELENGWLFDGSSAWMGVKDDTGNSDLDFDAAQVTIEAVYYDSDLSFGSGFAVCTFGTQKSTDPCGLGLLMNSAYNAKYINGMYVGATTNVWRDDLIDNSVQYHTVSANKTRAYDNGQPLVSLGVNHWSTNNGGRFVGATHTSNGTIGGFANGKIFAIRIYNRILSEREMLHNQRIDNERFNLGLELPAEPVSSIKFLHISDTHNSADAITECKSLMDADEDLLFTILTGDYSGQGGGYSSVDTPLQNLGSKLLMVTGNHDIYNSFSNNQANATAYLKSRVVNSDVVWGDVNDVASYWYRDVALSDSSKLRIIGIDSYDYRGGTGSMYDTIYTQTQVDWIVARITELRAKDYFIIAMHEPPVNAGLTDGQYNVLGKMDTNLVAKRRANKFCSARLWVWDTSRTNGNLIPRIVDAYMNNGTVNATVNNTNSDTNATVSSVTLSLDFTNASPATFLCYLGGHLHGEYAEYHPAFRQQLILLVDNANPSTLGQSSDIGTRSSDTAIGTRTNGKLINKIELDFDNETITITRVGQKNALSYNGFPAVTRDSISFPFVRPVHIVTIGAATRLADCDIEWIDDNSNVLDGSDIQIRIYPSNNETSAVDAEGVEVITSPAHTVSVEQQDTDCIVTIHQVSSDIELIITAEAQEIKYNVTTDLQNITANPASGQVTQSQDFVTQLTADQGYELPDLEGISILGDYDDVILNNGQLTVQGVYSDLEIIAEAVEQETPLLSVVRGWALAEDKYLRDLLLGTNDTGVNPNKQVLLTIPNVTAGTSDSHLWYRPRQPFRASDGWALNSHAIQAGAAKDTSSQYSTTGIYIAPNTMRRDLFGFGNGGSQYDDQCSKVCYTDYIPIPVRSTTGTLALNYMHGNVRDQRITSFTNDKVNIFIAGLVVYQKSGNNYIPVYAKSCQGADANNNGTYRQITIKVNSVCNISGSTYTVKENMFVRASFRMSDVPTKAEAANAEDEDWAIDANCYLKLQVGSTVEDLFVPEVSGERTYQFVQSLDEPYEQYDGNYAVQREDVTQ